MVYIVHRNSSCIAQEAAALALMRIAKLAVLEQYALEWRKRALPVISNAVKRLATQSHETILLLLDCSTINPIEVFHALCHLRNVEA